MNSALQDLSARELRKIANLKDKIEALQSELGKALAKAGGPVAKPGRKRQRKMSAAGRARISAAAKARWKKVKAAGKTRL